MGEVERYPPERPSDPGPQCNSMANMARARHPAPWTGAPGALAARIPLDHHRLALAAPAEGLRDADLPALVIPATWAASRGSAGHPNPIFCPTDPTADIELDRFADRKNTIASDCERA